MTLADLKGWLPVIPVLAGLVGAGYLSVYRLGEVEAQVAQLEQKVSSKAANEDVKAIQDTLGNVQLDVALLCSEAVKARGGNPFVECKSARIR